MTFDLEPVTEHPITKDGHVVEVTRRLCTRSFTKGRKGGEVRAIVIHTAETAETVKAAEALASWLAGPNPPRASWHFAIDADSITQSVRCRDTAWHAGPVNPYTVGLEHAGHAAQSPEDWEDNFSRATLERSAGLCAWLCERYDIPIFRPSLQDIASGHRLGGCRGIFGHWDVTRALSKGRGHTDPGPNFPWDTFLARVAELAPTQAWQGER